MSQNSENLLKKLGWNKSKKISIVIMFGFVIGLVVNLVVQSNAISYMSDDPTVCVNCHIMTPQYTSWAMSSHKNVVSCNDCHVPHENKLWRYFFKASDGLRHATIFTLRKEPHAIRIKSEGKEVVQDNCIRCHENQVMGISAVKVMKGSPDMEDGRYCFDCHVEVPHGKSSGLTSTPFAKAQHAKLVIPEWIKKNSSHK